MKKVEGLEPAVRHKEAISDADREWVVLPELLPAFPDPVIALLSFDFSSLKRSEYCAYY